MIMCFMDWRIGRLIRSNVIFANDGGNSAITLSPNQCRVGITFVNTADYILATPNEVVIQDSNGNVIHVISQYQPPWHITIATHGDLPTMGFISSNDVGAQANCVIEYIAPEWLLQLGIEQLKRESPSWPR